MTLTVLTDDEIRGLLDNLTASELEGFRGALSRALHEYSAGETSSVQQPDRISVHNAAVGTTTLFMPSCNSAGNSVKVITLTSPSPTTTTSSSPPPPPTTTTTTTQQPTTIPPTGATLLLTPSGQPLGLLHARTLTAFRTALASLCVILRRRRRHHHPRVSSFPPSPWSLSSSPSPGLNLLIFGCGEQAYWHARLALLARGPEVRRVVFVGRRRRRGQGGGSASEAGVVARLETLRAAGRAGVEGWEGCEVRGIRAGIGVGVGVREGGDDGGVEGGGDELDALLREADVVICCTPATEPLFDAGVWTRIGSAGEEGQKGRLVVAIGSYTPEMREVPGEWVRRVLEQGVVVVDTIAGAMVEAGELIEAGATREQLVELGTLLGPEQTDIQDQGVKGTRSDLDSCLEKGDVIYKSVGVGLMDLAVGMHLVEFAQEKGVGTHIHGF